MAIYLAGIVSAFFIAFISYQPAQASANTFTAKPIRLGDNLLSILRQNGFSEKEREKVLASDRGLRNLFLTLDTRYLVRRSGNTIELRMFDSQTSDAFKIVKQGKSVKALRYNPNYYVVLKKVEGRVHGSLLGSVLAQVNSNWVATRFTDAYVFDLVSRNVSRGSRFSFTVEKNYEAGQFVKYGEVLQTSLEIGGELVQKKFVRHKDAGVFFNSQDLFEQRPFYAPVEYLKVASKFQPNRKHPITGRHQPHLGIDFELPVGDPVYAPRYGTVVRYGNNRAAGNYIVLLHPNGMETSYNHLHRIDRRVRQGLKVRAGEKIGEVGCTGYCTRAHLHFAVKRKGRMVDPIKFIKPYPSHMERLLEARVASN
ncbi:M23 family metallopeptidase [Bdellovibrio reynosensis]|uniref:M23 family metallopeptidase n=1 Tax=Bdellovibrio reynosensis TaxID=2835041 RepID=A0ABY4C6M2_9BACT|nr:M23 family metallopeptidase [Bdellovibrio reynosensis]UOF00528.1 M23 family metallopeptidase [Bdellovibrio reynosensis]